MLEAAVYRHILLHFTHYISTSAVYVIKVKVLRFSV